MHIHNFFLFNFTFSFKIPLLLSIIIDVMTQIIVNYSRYSHGVSSPERHVRTRLYFTSESHIHSLLTVLRYGGLLDVSKICCFFLCMYFKFYLILKY